MNLLLAWPRVVTTSSARSTLHCPFWDFFSRRRNAFLPWTSSPLRPRWRFCPVISKMIHINWHRRTGIHILEGGRFQLFNYQRLWVLTDVGGSLTHMTTRDCELDIKPHELGGSCKFTPRTEHGLVFLWTSATNWVCGKIFSSIDSSIDFFHCFWNVWR